MKRPVSGKFGFDLLVQQALIAAAKRIRELAKGIEEAQNTVNKIGDSPIESLFHAAIVFHVDSSGYRRLYWGGDALALSEKAQVRATEDQSLIFQQQVTIPGIGRVDFVFHVCEKDRDGKEIWRRLIVECDGHDFHDRTKDQASRDRSRDRAAVMLGYEVFRFTGSDIWRDPWGCAEQVIAWADKVRAP